MKITNDTNLAFKYSLLFIPITIFGFSTSSLILYNGAIAALLISLSIFRHGMLFALPFTIYSPTAAMSGIPIFTTAIIISAIHLIFLFAKNRHSIEIIDSIKNWWISLVALLILALISVLLSDDLSNSLRFYSSYTQGFLLLLILGTLITTEAHFQKFCLSVCIASSAAFFYKLYIFITGANPPLLNNLTNTGVEWEAKTTYYLEGTLVQRFLWLGQEPNYTAALHFLPIGIALSFLGTKYKWSSIFAVSAILNFLQILGTLSRSGGILAFILMLVLLIQEKTSLRNKTIYLSIFILIIFAIQNQVDYIFSRLGTITSSVQDDGASGRFNYWDSAIGILSNSIFFGDGPGIFQLRLNDAAHNTYIEVLAELGLFGGSLFFISLIIPIIYTIKNTGRIKYYITTSYFIFLVMCSTITFYQFFLIIFMGYFCIMSSHRWPKISHI